MLTRTVPQRTSRSAIGLSTLGGGTYLVCSRKRNKNKNSRIERVAAEVRLRTVPREEDDLTIAPLLYNFRNMIHEAPGPPVIVEDNLTVFTGSGQAGSPVLMGRC